MAKYLLRALKQVFVFEITGKEEVVDAETEAQLNLRAREFMTREFSGDSEFGPPPEISVEIKKVGDGKPVTELPPDFKPVNRNNISPGRAPF